MKINFVQQILSPILDETRFESVSFCIAKKFYTYADLSSIAGQISGLIRKEETDFICVYATDDIRTYASILAIWACGKTFVPLNPSQPIERHREIVESIGSKLIISASPKYSIDLPDVSIIDTSGISSKEIINTIDISPIDDNAIAYVIFTSGSTGKPKGVPITRANLVAFVQSMDNIDLKISPSDKCLQPFDLTFDFSVSSYLIPLIKGASIYTVPIKSVKFLYIAALLEDHKLTVLQMVPSMMRNLLPYLDEIDLSSVRYNIFCGEALMSSSITKWHSANPKMVTYNMYGPTEDTVFCTYYLINNSIVDNIEASNDIVSIGVPFINCQLLLMDDTDQVVTELNTQGELCLSGEQLTPGYWHNEKDNREKFFELNGIRYYRTGDICCWGTDNNLTFIGRKDFQVKVNGFRVELGEIEKTFRDAADGRFCVVMPYLNEQGNTELVIAIEGKEYDLSDVKNYMISRLPKYEIPSMWRFVKTIPLNRNGKVDRSALKQSLGI